MSEHEDGQVSEAERRKMMADLEAATERVREGEVDFAEVAVPHGTMRIYRDEENPAILHVDTLGDEPGSKVAACSYPGGPFRPVGYPESLPFLAGCGTMVSEAGGGRMRSAIWMKPADPDGAFEDLRRQTVDLGWDEQPSMPTIGGLGPVRQVVFGREGREGALRLITFNEVAQIMWMEGKRKADEEEA